MGFYAVAGFAGKVPLKGHNQVCIIGWGIKLTIGRLAAITRKGALMTHFGDGIKPRGEKSLERGLG
jgi:hypothetical protein